MKRPFVLLIGFLMLSVATFRCATETNKTLAYGEKLAGAIDNFEKFRVKSKEGFEKAIENVEDNLSEENPDLTTTAKDWEKDWNKLMNRIEKLKSNFTDIGQFSNDYFAKLDELANGISEQSIRKDQVTANQALRAEWEKAYKEAETNIQEIDQLLIKGADFHKVVLLTSMREKLSSKVTELKEMTAEAGKILAELKQFTEEGKRIVGQS